MSELISPDELKQRIVSGSELAILDVREEGVYFDCHLFWASNVPLSLLELRIASLVPRRSARIVVYDTAGKRHGPARRAQSRLSELGYADVGMLAGGIDSWRDAGLELFSGLNVPSKAFGEFLLQTRHPPQVEAHELSKRLKCGDNLVVLDSRPMDEYCEMSIPSAIDTPGAELVHRVFELAPDPDTAVVVNCAGRTRSIVGAQSLINAGVPNQVSLLKDGTMGWNLAGLKLDHGKTAHAPWPSSESYAKALEAADRVKKDYQVREVDLATLQGWADDAKRTLYVFDVRTVEEFESGHLPGARHVAGGQLVQTTDEHVAVRQARIVLVDNRSVRAVMTASWLMQMGHREVYVLTAADADQAATRSGPQQRNILGFEQAPTLSAGELKAVLQSGESCGIIDVSCSRNHLIRHIPGASWCVRQRLPSALAVLPPTGLLVLTSEDGVIAHLASQDLSRTNPRQLVRVLSGGNQAWEQAGFTMEDGMEHALCEVDDIWDKPYHGRTSRKQRMRAYLDWEVQLMEQVDRDGTANFYSSPEASLS